MRFQCGRFIGRTQSERFLHLIRVIRHHVRIVILGIRNVICSVGGFVGICGIVVCNRCSVVVICIVGSRSIVIFRNFDIIVL